MNKGKRKPTPYIKRLYRKRELLEFLLEKAKTKEDEERLRKRLAEITMAISRERGKRALNL
jgi:hypothetical protein